MCWLVPLSSLLEAGFRVIDPALLVIPSTAHLLPTLESLPAPSALELGLELSNADSLSIDRSGIAALGLRLRLSVWTRPIIPEQDDEEGG
jgi:hypothetical protein